MKVSKAQAGDPQFVVSDHVSFPFKGHVWHGTVAKKGRTSAVIVCEEDREFRVPYTLLVKVKNGASPYVQTRSEVQRAQFAQGDRVHFTFRGQPVQGVINRLNPQRAHVVADDGREFRASYATLQRVSEAPCAQPSGFANPDFVASLARNLFEQHQLSHWSFQFDNGRKRAGCCHYGTQVISLSYEFIKHAPEHEIRDTLLHEIAHALVGPRHHHDQVWRAKALEIGCSGDRCHDMQFTQPRYIISCARGCWVTTAERRRHHILCKWCRGHVLYQTFTEERWQKVKATDHQQ